MVYNGFLENTPPFLHQNWPSKADYLRVWLGACYSGHLKERLLRRVASRNDNWSALEIASSRSLSGRRSQRLLWRRLLATAAETLRRIKTADKSGSQ